MSGLRRFIIGLSELLVWCWIVAGMIGGALAGKAIGQMMNSPNSYIGARRVEFSVAGIPDTEFFGLLFGGVLGFLLPALAASSLFLLIEIQKNSQQSAEALSLLRSSGQREPRI
ncbi:MAG: hypothetical protein NTV56_13900 [Alphaproteobacteria bacterium]|nr:hypothetical protein [Alphaproteobacteria bacterium]